LQQVPKALLRFLRRVRPDRHERAAEAQQTAAVKLKSCKGRPPNRGQGDDLNAVHTPGEMLAPSVSAGMEQRRGHSSGRIGRIRSAQLMTIASAAGKRQILGLGTAAIAFRMDMLGVKWVL